MLKLAKGSTARQQRQDMRSENRWRSANRKKPLQFNADKPFEGCSSDRRLGLTQTYCALQRKHKIEFDTSCVFPGGIIA
jgi:hypothetical protein